ncbi:MAG: nucleotidyltransferase family protein, partial [Caulobacteraceae bacterium]
LKPWLATEGLVWPRLFGSHARDEGRSGSDVDLMVDFARPLGLRFFQIEEEASARLGMKVDLVTEEALAPDIRLAALRDAIDV